MDILKQYYNEGGQIVSRTPDLTKREFYRDVMCRHRFNEMFVAATENNGIGYYETSSGVYMCLGNGFGGVPCAENGPWSTMDGNGTHEIKEAYIVKKDSTFVRCVHALQSTESPLYGGVNFSATTSMSLTQNFSISGIVKCPDGAITENYGEDVSFVIDGTGISIGINLNFTNTNDDFTVYLVGFVYEKSTGVNVTVNTYTEWNYDSSWNSVNNWPSVLSDGSWNKITLACQDGSISLLLNGEVVNSASFDIDIATAFLGEKAFNASIATYGGWYDNEYVQDISRVAICQAYLEGVS